MSHLLGAQDCVESLRRDVIDLQGSLAEVFSRTGPVRFRSWKFPDKNSCDLDLVQLLGHYDYIEGEEEFNQHSHSVLLELVIDRLMILLQSFNAYIEQVLGGQRAEDSGKAEGPVCVGPVVKHYWNNLIQFSSQQRKQRTNTAIRLETSPSSTHLDPQISSPTTSRRSATSRSPRTFRPSLVRCCSVSCQTVKLALVPCDACAEVQATLQSSAHAVASLCQALGLSCTRQSLLQSVGVTLQLGRLSACDLALWAREQQADMGRVQKHVIDVQEKVNSLTDALQKAEKEKEKLRVKLEKEEKKSMRDQEERRKREELQRRLQEEKEESTRRREEEWERLMEEQRHRRDEELKTQQEQLKQGTVVLELKISELKAELELQRKTLQCVESEKVSLVEDVHRLRLEEVRWKEMEEEKKDVEMKLSDTQKLLDKESAKYHSTQRQHELMGMKQRALVERVEALVQQVEELQSSLEECEEEKVKLADMLTHTTKERNTLQEQLTRQKSLNEDRAKQCVRLRDMDKSVSKLKEDLRQAEERERILVAFPELNPHKHTLPQSTGNVLCDMEQQLKGNSIRIRVLEQENATLNKTLSKLKQTQLKQMIRLADQSAGDQKLCPNSRSSEVGTEKIEKEKQIRKTSVSSSSSLHCQTLSLTIVPNTEGTYTNLRQATCTRSAGTNRRRK